MATSHEQISAEMLEATRAAAAASIAAGLISASGRPHSVGEAVKLLRNVQWSLWPNERYGAYQGWKKNFREHEEHK